MAMKEKTLRKGVLKREWNGKRDKKGQQAVQSVRMEKSWVIMKD